MNKKGFTLVELLAVIVVLGLVITITATKGFGAFDNTKKAITKQNLNAIKEAANVLAEQIDNCDDDIDSELWKTGEGDKNLADKNRVNHTCDALKEKMSSTDCISVTVDYLITNQYLSENKDFENLKDKTVRLCKEDKKITIDMSKIENPDNKPNNPDKDDNPETNPDDNKGSEEPVQKPEEIKKTLAETIKDSANAGGENRTIMGTEVTEFTSISGENDRVLNTAPDDYGTSYYFRGNVLDNYVFFANKLWRVVRINGDNTVRLVLEDVAKNTNGSIIKVKFNSSSEDNAYIGYMYGTPRSTTYDDTHKNINDSTIKTQVDAWYKTNIVDTNNSKYIADTLFCNDKTLASFGIGGVDRQLGYGTKKTYYSIAQRLVFSTGITGITISKPTFKCAENATNDYSRFTVNVTTLPSGNKTNGNLIYPVGLLSADEVAYAGAYKYNKANKTYYLYNSTISYNWWLSSPYYFPGIIAHATYIDSHLGSINFNSVKEGSYAFRPSINLRAETQKNTGDGTKENPYTVKLS